MPQPPWGEVSGVAGQVAQHGGGLAGRLAAARGLDGQHLLEVMHQLVDRGVAVARLLRGGALDDRGQRGRDLRAPPLHVRERLPHVLHCDCHLCIRLERDLPGQHLVEHDPQRVDVGLLGHLVSERLLRRDVVGCPEHPPRGREALGLERAGDAEVRDLGPTVGIDQHVLGLHVAVDEPVRVGALECARDLDRIGHGLRHGQAAVAPDAVLERLALDVLEDDVGSALVLAGVDHRDHVVMGGLAREYSGDLSSLVIEWLDAADQSGMPLDPRVWQEAPLRSTYPACMAVKAAAEQGTDAAGRYLRSLREGIMCRRRRLDSAEALVEEARGAGLDPQRFRIDLESHAIVEAFGADLEEARSVPDAARERGLARERGQGSDGERLALPSLRFVGEAGDEWRGGDHPYDEWRAAAIAAGARPSGEPRPHVLAALKRFGRMAVPEVEAVGDLAGPRASAELWRLAAEWRVRPHRFLTGELWEIA